MNKNAPLISVIIGVYNCAETLQEALDSLLSQTYNDFRVIICDDGSTDSTYQIAEQYTNLYPNFTLLQNSKNEGLNFTLNHCLKFVDTEFIARMDGDDISLPERFEKQISFLSSHTELDFVSSSMIYFDESGDFKTGSVKNYPDKFDFVHGTPFCHAPAMIRRSAMEQVNGYSEKKLLLRVEDYHLWFKMYAQGLRGYNFSEPLYKMRDDRNAAKRRKFKYRINEAYVKIIGYKMLHLPFYYYIYAIRPILVGLLPLKVYNFLHRI